MGTVVWWLATRNVRTSPRRYSGDVFRTVWEVSSSWARFSLSDGGSFSLSLVWHHQQTSARAPNPFFFFQCGKTTRSMDIHPCFCVLPLRREQGPVVQGHWSKFGHPSKHLKHRAKDPAWKPRCAIPFPSADEKCLRQSLLKSLLMALHWGWCLFISALNKPCGKKGCSELENIPAFWIIALNAQIADICWVGAHRYTMHGIKLESGPLPRSMFFYVNGYLTWATNKVEFTVIQKWRTWWSGKRPMTDLQ